MAEAAVPTRLTYFYIDPSGPLLDPELGFGEIEFQPRLIFFDANLWQTAQKLKAQIEHQNPSSRLYAEALIVVLCHELIRINDAGATAEPPIRGGLASWQQKRVAQYIEENLADRVSLATLAELARLSPYHFARTFKHSFGVPPHRYHMMRRIERAQELAGQSEASITEIALHVGFSETSGFTTGFRKLTGVSPTEYRRSLE